MAPTRSPMHRHAKPASLATIMLCACALMGQASLDVCSKLEAGRRLVHLQLRDSKLCTESTVAKGWTDCTFRAGGTTLRLVGALGVQPAERVRGVWGSGFYVDSVDANHTIRVLADDEFGLMLRVDSRDNLQATGCIYNEAYITLNAQVMGSGDLNTVKYKLDRPLSEPDRIKAVQEALVQLGYMSGSPDGVIGPSTRAALQRYRTAKNIPASATDKDVNRLLLLDAMLEATKKLQSEYERVGPTPPDKR